MTSTPMVTLVRSPPAPTPFTSSSKHNASSGEGTVIVVLTLYRVEPSNGEPSAVDDDEGVVGSGRPTAVGGTVGGRLRHSGSSLPRAVLQNFSSLIFFFLQETRNRSTVVRLVGGVGRQCLDSGKGRRSVVLLQGS